MSIEKTEAISLGTFKLGDTSRIASFLTRDFGLIKCVAKGSRSKKNKYGGALEPFYESQIVFYYKSNRDLQTLSQADVVRFFPGIQNCVIKTACANVSVEMIRRILMPQETNTELFILEQDFLNNLEETKREMVSLGLLFRFLADFSRILGFQMNLECCARCGKEPERFFFLHTAGKFLCESCFPGSRHAGISRQIWETACQNKPFCGLIGKEYLDAYRVLLDFYSYHLEKPLRINSMGFLESVLPA